MSLGKITLRGMIILLITIVMTSCAISKLSLLRFQDRTWRFCQESEVDKPHGKICYKYCEDYSFWSKKCKSWKIESHLVSDPVIHRKLRDSSMVIRQEVR